MKRAITAAALMLFGLSFAQTPPATTNMGRLEITYKNNSLYSRFAPPRPSDCDFLLSPSTGDMCYDLTSARLEIFNGTVWVAASPGSSATNCSEDIVSPQVGQICYDLTYEVNLFWDGASWRNLVDLGTGHPNRLAVWDGPDSLGYTPGHIDFDTDGDGILDWRWCGDYDEDGILEYADDAIPCDCLFQGLTADCSGPTAITTPTVTQLFPGKYKGLWRPDNSTTSRYSWFIRKSDHTINAYGVELDFSDAGDWADPDGTIDNPNSLDDEDAIVDSNYVVYVHSADNVRILGLKIDGGSDIAAQDEAGEAPLYSTGGRNNCQDTDADGTWGYNSAEPVATVAAKSSTNHCTLDTAYGIFVYNSDYTVIKDVEITRIAQQSLDFIDGCDHFLVDNLDLSYSAEHGVIPGDNSHYGSIVNSHFEHCAAQGSCILPMGAEHLKIANNTFKDSLSNVYRTELDDSDLDTKYVLFTGNNITNNLDSDPDDDGVANGSQTMIGIQSTSPNGNGINDNLNNFLHSFTNNKIEVGPLAWVNTVFEAYGPGDAYNRGVLFSNNQIYADWNLDRDEDGTIVDDDSEVDRVVLSIGTPNSLISDNLIEFTSDGGCDGTADGDSAAYKDNGVQLVTSLPKSGDTFIDCDGCVLRGNTITALSDRGGAQAVYLNSVSHVTMQDNILDWQEVKNPLSCDANGDGTAEYNPERNVVLGLNVTNSRIDSNTAIIGWSWDAPSYGSTGFYLYGGDVDGTAHYSSDNAITNNTCLNDPDENNDGTEDDQQGGTSCIGINGGYRNVVSGNTSRGSVGGPWTEYGLASDNAWGPNTSMGSGAIGATILEGHGVLYVPDGDGDGTLSDGAGYLAIAGGDRLRLYDTTADGTTNYVELAAPATMSASRTMTLPNASYNGTVAIASGANSAGVVMWGLIGTACNTICTNAGLAGCVNTIPSTGAFTGNCTDTTTGSTHHGCLCY